MVRRWTQYTQQDRQEDQGVEQTKHHYQEEYLKSMYIY